MAPPQASSDQKPTLSSLAQTGSMSAVRMRVASSDWCASRRMRSVTWTFLDAMTRGFGVITGRGVRRGAAAMAAARSRGRPTDGIVYQFGWCSTNQVSNFAARNSGVLRICR